MSYLRKEIFSRVLTPSDVLKYHEAFKQRKVLFIDGIAAAGKTSLPNVINADIVEVAKKYGFFYLCKAITTRNVDNLQELKVRYLIAISSLITDHLSCVDNQDKFLVFDRSPIAVLSYQVVHSFTNVYEAKTLSAEDDADDKRLVDIVEKIKSQDESLTINDTSELENEIENFFDIIFRPEQIKMMVGDMAYNYLIVNARYSQVNDILERMIKRENGVDILTKEFIIFQIAIFKILAIRLQIPSVNYEELEGTVELLRFNEIESLPLLQIEPTNYVSLKKGHPGDAGFDLKCCRFSCARTEEKMNNDIFSVLIRERVKIKPGYYGKIDFRSSNAAPLQITSGGIIDADYEGPLSVDVIKINKEVGANEIMDQIKLQLIISYIPQCDDISGLGTKRTCRRRLNGFGSTDKKD